VVYRWLVQEAAGAAGPGGREFNSSVMWFLRMYPLEFTEIHVFEAQKGVFEIPPGPRREPSEYNTVLYPLEFTRFMPFISSSKFCRATHMRTLLSAHRMCMRMRQRIRLDRGSWRLSGCVIRLVLYGYCCV